MDLNGIIATAIGLGVFLVFGIPVISAILVAALGAIALGAAVLGAMALYVVGIPLAIAQRVRTGYWP